MKFPGFSLDKASNIYIEEYNTLDRLRETLFIEVRKIKTLWLFDLDNKDLKAYDEGVYTHRNQA